MIWSSETTQIYCAAFCLPAS